MSSDAGERKIRGSGSGTMKTNRGVSLSESVM